MSKFEDHLWSDVVSRYGRRLAAAAPMAHRPRPRHTGRWRAAAVAVVAMGGLLLVETVGTEAPPAYAVTTARDGSVAIVLRDLTARDEVNRRLGQLGVPARIVPLTRGCRTALRMPWQYLQPSAQPFSETPRRTGAIQDWTVVILPRRIPPGDTLVLAPARIAHGFEMADAIVSGPVPSCSSPTYTEGGTRLGLAPPRGTRGSSAPAALTTTTAPTPGHHTP